MYLFIVKNYVLDLIKESLYKIYNFLKYFFLIHLFILISILHLNCVKGNKIFYLFLAIPKNLYYFVISFTNLLIK